MLVFLCEREGERESERERGREREGERERDVNKEEWREDCFGCSRQYNNHSSNLLGAESLKCNWEQFNKFKFYKKSNDPCDRLCKLT